MLLRNPIKTLYPLILKWFQWHLLKNSNVCELDFVKSVPMKTEENPRFLSSSSSFRAARLPAWLSSRLFYLVPVLSSVSPDVGTLTSLQMRKWGISWHLGAFQNRIGRRSFQWMVHPASGVQGLVRDGAFESTSVQSKKKNPRLSQGHHRWPGEELQLCLTSFPA